MPQIVAQLAYVGTGYLGIASQENTDNTVAYYFSAAVQQTQVDISDWAVGGRTDKGVHGLGQVIHFCSRAERSEKAWQFAINRHLPPSIQIMQAQIWDKPFPFHARHGAIARTYHYLVHVGKILPPPLQQYVYHFGAPIDKDLLHKAAALCVGGYDFTGFRASSCQAHSAKRVVDVCRVDFPGEEYVLITIRANAFVQKMVRNMVGALLSVAAKKRNVEWLHGLLHNTVEKSYSPAPAKGLVLGHVEYVYEVFAQPTCWLGFCLPQLQPYKGYWVANTYRPEEYLR